MLYLFFDWGIAEGCSLFCWGIGQPSVIMAAWQFLWLGIIIILFDFVMQRKISCRFWIEFRNDKMTLITLSLGLRVVEYMSFYQFLKSIAVVNKNTFLHFFYFCQLQLMQIHLLWSIKLKTMSISIKRCYELYDIIYFCIYFKWIHM